MMLKKEGMRVLARRPGWPMKRTRRRARASSGQAGRGPILEPDDVRTSTLTFRGQSSRLGHRLFSWIVYSLHLAHLSPSMCDAWEHVWQCGRASLRPPPPSAEGGCGRQSSSLVPLVRGNDGPLQSHLGGGWGRRPMDEPSVDE